MALRLTDAVEKPSTYLDYLIKPLTQFSQTETFKQMSSELQRRVLVHIVTRMFTDLHSTAGDLELGDDNKVRCQLLVDILTLRRQLLEFLVPEFVEKTVLAAVRNYCNGEGDTVQGLVAQDVRVYSTIVRLKVL